MYIHEYVCIGSISLWVGIQSAGDLVSRLAQLRILHSTLSPFDLNIACLSQSTKLTTTNMYIARARCESLSAVKSSGLNAHSSWGWAVEFKFLLDPWFVIGLWAAVQSAGEWVPPTAGFESWGCFTTLVGVSKWVSWHLIFADGISILSLWHALY